MLQIATTLSLTALFSASTSQVPTSRNHRVCLYSARQHSAETCYPCYVYARFQTKSIVAILVWLYACIYKLCLAKDMLFSNLVARIHGVGLVHLIMMAACHCCMSYKHSNIDAQIPTDLPTDANLQRKILCCFCISFPSLCICQPKLSNTFEVVGFTSSVALFNPQGYRH